MKFYGNMGIYMDGDIFGTGKGNLAVQNGVRHMVAGFYYGIYRIQIRIQFVQIRLDRLQISVGGKYLHRLYVVAVIMPPAADLAVHILYLLIVGFDQFPLIGGQPFVDLTG